MTSRQADRLTDRDIQKDSQIDKQTGKIASVKIILKKDGEGVDCGTVGDSLIRNIQAKVPTDSLMVRLKAKKKLMTQTDKKMTILLTEC